jgi:hypothetical protein
VTIIRRVGTRVIKDTGTVNESVEKEFLLRCMKETVTILIRVVGVALRPLRRASNVHLVYALIHDNNILLDLFLNPIIASLIEDKPGISKNPQLNNNNNSTNSSSSRINSSVNANGTLSGSNEVDNIGSYNTNCLQPIEVASLIKHYLKTLESLQEQLNSYMTAKKAIQLLRQEIEDEQEAILNIRANELSTESTGRLDNDDAMTSMTTFTYEEGDSPEDFFVPFTWTNMIRNAPEMFWFLNSITLFDPLQSGLSIQIEDNNNDNNNDNYIAGNNV